MPVRMPHRLSEYKHSRYPQKTCILQVGSGDLDLLGPPRWEYIFGFGICLMFTEKVHVMRFKLQRGSAHFELDMVPVERAPRRPRKDCVAND